MPPLLVIFVQQDELHLVDKVMGLGFMGEVDL